MRRELTVRIALFFIGTAVLTGMAISTSISYYNYSHTLASDSLSQSIKLIAFTAILSVGIALNFFYFFYQTVKTHPRIARGLPMGFAVALSLCYLVYEFFFDGRISSEGMDFALLLILGAWLLLNILIHFAFRERAVLP
ncbi:MAG: hypothetical protein ABR577_11515 [Pyrinomonadaceae bacterium]